MKKGQVYEGIVRQVNFPNKGVVSVGEETCIVKDCLPGQKVKLIVNKVRKGKAEARLLEVTEKSPLETGCPCSRFGVCGGCTYLSLPYEEQLRIKEGQVKRLLDGVLAGQKEGWAWEGIKGSPKKYEYRNKMEFSFGDEMKDGPLSLGLHKRGSFYDVVTVADCRIVEEDYRRILGAVREYFASRGIRYYHRSRHEGFLRHLLVRKASQTGEILIALVTTSQDPWQDGAARPKEEGGAGGTLALIKGFRDVLLSLEKEGKLRGRITGILHLVNDAMGDVVKSDRTDVLYGKDHFYEELLGLRFKISVFSFFQTNSYGAEVLYRTAREYALAALGDAGMKPEGAGTWPGGAKDGGNQENRGRVIFDLYSGTGTIAQLMAGVADQVIGVEIVEEAVEAARINARENGIENCLFLAGDVLKVLDEVKEKPDLIILDPPREGIHPKVLPKMIGYGVERIVYLSCKPTSLARDLEGFLQNGYHVERAVAVDQFPWTANVETVVSLRYQNPRDSIPVT